MDPAVGGFEVDLRVSLRSLTQADRERLQAPEHLWSRIEAGLRSAVSEQAADAPRAKVIPLRRQRRVVAVVGVSVLAACAALAIPLALNGRETAKLLAAAPLSNAGLAAFDTTPEGSARLVESRGQTYLEISVRNVPERAGEHLELWMIDTSVQGMVSLGPYTGSHRYAVPDGISAEAFPVVDLSLEPGDGVPTHSGVSVVRGTLPVNDRSA
ncbi:MAG: anti-sigma factor [Actinomycetota bacterium]